MMTPLFVKLIDRTLGHEGQYSNDVNDPGGETNWGISKRAYPLLNIKQLTREDALGIYYRDFWLKLPVESSTDGALYQLLDSAVNSGIVQTFRFLQRAVGVADDGHFGPVSRRAVEKCSESDFIMLFVAERLDFMTRLKNWPNAGKGWARRIAQNLRYGAEDS